MNKGTVKGEIMRFFSAITAICIGFASLGYSGDKEEASLWLIQEEFIKFGAKDAYENLQEGWMEGFAKTLAAGGMWRNKQNLWTIYGLQVQQEPQYMYMIPLRDSCSLIDFFNKKNQYNQALPSEQKSESQSLFSLLNFSVNSLHLYLKDCSYPQTIREDVFEKKPFISYSVYGITPGYETVFEDAIRQLVADAASSRSSACWRVWRVLIGSDSPKYVIMAYGAASVDLEGAKKILKPLEGSVKDIIRNKKEGTGIFKPGISLIP